MDTTRKLIGIFAIMLILPAGGALSGVAAQAGSVATLDPVQGMVQHHAADEPEDAWQTALTAVPVQERDGIRTDQHGLAYLTFFEGVEIEILPSSVVTVSKLDILQVRTGGPFDISLQVLAGDTLSRVEKVSDPASRYEIVTPGASMTVRGTEFWTSVSPAGDTTVRVVQGIVEVSGITPDGQVTRAVSVTAGSQVTISSAGEIGSTQPVAQTPRRPPQTSLAPATCGNGQCEAAEQSAAACPLDCNPPSAPSEPARLEFLWGNMTCVFEPPAPVHGSLRMTWGIGCFDTSAQASAHPHPADYQLTIDGQAWDMGTLQQSGPHVHAPFCPWGWSYALGPVQLPVGVHTLTLVETATDTWEGRSGGHTAGDTNTLTCRFTVLPPVIF